MDVGLEKETLLIKTVDISLGDQYAKKYSVRTFIDTY